MVLARCTWVTRVEGDHAGGQLEVFAQPEERGGNHSMENTGSLDAQGSGGLGGHRLISSSQFVLTAGSGVLKTPFGTPGIASGV